MVQGSNNSEHKGRPPAAGQFGIAAGATTDMRGYLPTGCPSVEQFEARFILANDRHQPPRAA